MIENTPLIITERRRKKYPLWLILLFMMISIAIFYGICVCITYFLCSNDDKRNQCIFGGGFALMGFLTIPLGCSLLIVGNCDNYFREQSRYWVNSGLY